MIWSPDEGGGNNDSSLMPRKFTVDSDCVCLDLIVRSVVRDESGHTRRVVPTVGMLRHLRSSACSQLPPRSAHAVVQHGGGTATASGRLRDAANATLPPPGRRRCPLRAPRARASTSAAPHLTAGHKILAREGLGVGAQLEHLRVVVERGEEVDQLLAAGALDLDRDLNAAVEQLGDLVKILLDEAARGHRGRADPDRAGRHRRDVAVHRVLVERDVRLVEERLHLGARQAERAQVPQHEVVVRAVRRELVALVGERLGEVLAVSHDLLRVRFELGLGGLRERGGERGDLVVVRAALQRREHRHVDRLLEGVDPARRAIGQRGPRALAVEDHPRARAAKRLVRGRRHDVAVRERARVQPARDEARYVRNVREQQRADLIGNLTELRKVPVARVGGCTGHDHLRAEEEGHLLDLVKVEQPSLVAHVVGQRLEVDRRRRDALLGRVVAVRQVAARREREAHDAVVRLEQRRVHGKVGRAARIGLHVDAPLLRVDVEYLERALHAEQLHLVDELVAAVVAVARHALGVLVRHARTERVHHGH
mmetsp:Transcript_3675/g.11435  ORF Transcript_3675/g.11435 Transcript_3675/m.11435 type:complete len:539 (-) Transcript_3675:171-1787(-)